MTCVRLERLVKSYPRTGHPSIAVLNGLDFAVESNKLVTLVGPNGCGKSTLLSLVAGTSRPDSGRVAIDVGEEREPRIGYVWQDYRASLLPWLDAADNIAFPLRLQGVPHRTRRDRAEQSLRDVVATVAPHSRLDQLSGGQKQLVSILRSLIVAPDVMLLDEPFSALDQQARWSMCMFLERAWMKDPRPTFFVSHDVDEAILLADQIVLLRANGMGIEMVIDNPLPRPRDASALNASAHIECRRAIIEFLSREGAVGGRDLATRQGVPCKNQ